MLIRIACVLLFTTAIQAEEIKVLSWNVESDFDDSDTNDPEVIAQRLTALQTDRGPYDLIGLTEVRAASGETYQQAASAAGVQYHAFTSESGGDDRMMLLVRKNRFNLVDGAPASELANDGSDIVFPGEFNRRPFMVTLRDAANGNQQLIFMVNHLNRGNSRTRQRQAEGLREWAIRQSVPIVAVGDYNFDYDFGNLIGNQSMAIFMRRNKFVWKWVIPDAEFQINGTSDATRTVSLLAEFTDTNWDGDSDGNDRFRDSILDFVFLGQDARRWKASATVIVEAGDFPDNNTTSDHRPIEAILDPAGTAPDVGGPTE